MYLLSIVKVNERTMGAKKTTKKKETEKKELMLPNGYKLKKLEDGYTLLINGRIFAAIPPIEDTEPQVNKDNALYLDLTPVSLADSLGLSAYIALSAENIIQYKISNGENEVHAQAETAALIGDILKSNEKKNHPYIEKGDYLYISTNKENVRGDKHIFLIENPDALHGYDYFTVSKMPDYIPQVAFNDDPVKHELYAIICELDKSVITLDKLLSVVDYMRIINHF